MTFEQKRLLEILSLELFKGPGFRKREDFWNSLSEEQIVRICREAELQTVFPLVFYSFKRAFPDLVKKNPKYRGFMDTLQNHYTLSIRNLYDHGELHNLLTKNGIRYCILKGQVSALYYTEPLLRAMGDVDFLVDVKERERAERLLLHEGFVKEEEGENHNFHWQLSRDKTILEMHWDVPGVPKNRKSLDPYLHNILDDAAEARSGDIVFMAPSRFHHGLVLLLHALSHLTYTGMGMRHLLDWLAFEDGFEEEEFMAMYEKPLKEIGLWRFAQTMTKIGSGYLGCKKRSFCRDIPKELCSGVLEDILSGGNFGIKDRTRQLQTKVMRNTVSMKIGHGGMFRNLFVNINAKAKMYYPPSGKNPLLLPVGWGKVVLQYVKWIRKNRTHILDKDLLKTAKKRQDLYAELNLFEAEGKDTVHAVTE